MSRYLGVCGFEEHFWGTLHHHEQNFKNYEAHIHRALQATGVLFTLYYVQSITFSMLLPPLTISFVCLKEKRSPGDIAISVYYVSKSLPSDWKGIFVIGKAFSWI